MINDDFIESIITPKTQSNNETMISREFNGMEAVAKFEKEDQESENGDDG